MSTTAGSECPPSVSEKPLLDHITTDSPEDSYTESDNPAKLGNAKNIGTTTPEVEGEDNEPVTTVEDYPSTPVSTMDSSLQTLPLTGENKEDSTPLPPTPEETEFGVNGEAETASPPPPVEAEERQLDGAEDLRTEGESLEIPVEKTEEGSIPEATIPELNAPEDEPSEAAPGANGGEPAATDETPTSLDDPHLDTGVSETAEPAGENDGDSGDTPAAEVAEGVPEESVKAEKLSENIDTKRQDNTETQTIQDSELAVGEPEAEKAGYEKEKDNEVQQEHESEEAEHPEVTELAMSSTDPDPKTAEHIPDAVMEAVIEERKDEQVGPEAEETDTTVGDHEPTLESEAVLAEADPMPSPEGDSTAAEGSEMTQIEAKDPGVKDAPELIASSEAEETTEVADAEPGEESLPMEKGEEVAEESKGEVEDEAKRNSEVLTEESEEEPKEEVEPKTTEPTEAEPASISSIVGEDTPDPEPAMGSTGGVGGEPNPEANELVEAEPQAAGVLPVTEPSREGDDSPPVEADTKVEPEYTVESEEDMKVETKCEVEEGPKSEAAEISEPVKPEPAIPDALPLTGAPIDGEITSVDVDANPQSEPAEESEEDKEGVLKAEPLVEGFVETAEETVDSAPEEPRAPEEAGPLAAVGASPDDSPNLELKEAIAAEPEVPVVPEHPTEPEGSKEQSAPEFMEHSVESVKEMDPELVISNEKEQEIQDATPDDTEGQKEAFEKRMADAEPDEVIAVEEPPAPLILPVEESTIEQTSGDSEGASSELPDEIKAEPTTSLTANPTVNEEGEDLAQDEPVVVSHDDAPPDDVERAEAAVEYPKPDPQEEIDEASKAIEAEKDDKLLVSPKQAQTEPEGEATAGSSTPGKPQFCENPDDIALERVPTPEVVKEEDPEESKIGESGAVVSTGVNDKAREPTSSKELEEASVQAEDNPSEPVSAESSEPLLPVIGGVIPTAQPEASAEPQPGEQMFSVSPLPDSKTFGNPIDLQPGEPIPVCLTEASAADNVELDEEIFKKFDDKAPVAEEAGVGGSDDGTSGKILAAGVGAGLVGLGTYAAVNHYDKTEAGKHGSEEGFPVVASPTDPKVGDVGSPATDASANSISSTAQEQVLPVEVSFTTPAISKELSESPVVSRAEIGPAHPVGKPTEEIIGPASTEVLDKEPLPASATDIPDESAVGQSVGKLVPGEGDEAIAEPAPRDAPSPVHGVAAPEEHVLKVLRDTETSETPAIVVSAPPNPATGSSTAEVIQPSSSEVAFDEGPANKARESGEIFAHPVWNESVSPLLQYSLENTPEGVRRRNAPGAGGEVSRPTSSGTDTVSTLRHKNIMNGFWHVVLFGWLGGFGRFFGGIFSKSRSRKQRK